ncbi:MAG: hypothetical protein JXA50_05350 [Deltaproteobacteria bacterium]|nr:hypothetical protein [Deltaproteobacteria bacterium]
MERDDLSSKLIHFTKGDQKEAVANIRSILNQSKLVGGSGFIKGGYRCVCFTESPIGKFPHLFSDENPVKFPYAPLGIMVDKTWLWERGGRPVIYQSDEEYNLLHEQQRWRHKIYDPLVGIDFTWEREWRIKVDELDLDPSKTTVIVPKRLYIEQIKTTHSKRIQGVVLSLGEEAAGFVEPLPWHFIALEDLGVRFW